MLSSKNIVQQAALLPADNQEYLDENKIKSMQLHNAGITAVTISTTGLWIFTGGADGIVYMVGSSVRALATCQMYQNAQKVYKINS